MADPWSSDDLVGRDEQLRAFERVLDQRRPAVVLVTGRVGSGKSRLLSELTGQARARGWRTAPPPREPPYVVTRDTTPRSFARQVERMLAGRPGELGLDANPVLDAQALSRGMAASSLAAAPTPPPAIAGDADAATLIDSIRDACPALFAVDGFHPNVTFGRWLSERLVPAVKESDLPVVALLTLETEPSSEILGFADEHLHLDRLDEAATERYFLELGKRLSPPLGVDELRTYVKAAADTPELVGCLRRVLALAARAGG